MEFPFVGNSVRRGVVVASIAVAGLLIWQASQIWLANHLVQSQSAAKIEHGAWLLPGDADAWDRLGRFRQWDLMDPDPSSAITDYRKAVEHEPTSPYYWMDLGSAYEEVGDIGNAREALRHAEEIYPASADVAWHYGNFLLRQGPPGEGMAEISKAVRIDPSLLPEAASRVWRSSHDINLLVNQLLPANLDAYFAAIDFFDSTHEAEPALAIWHKIVMLGKPFPLKRSFPFIDELMWENRSDDAQRVWLDALHAAAVPHEIPADHSIIWDGGFTQPFSNGGLGWRWDPPLGVAIDFGTPRQFSGTRSVRLDFGGSTNLELDEPRQYVPVEPNRIYDFRGYLRTERISTESGVRFSIVDPRRAADANAMTDNLTGTNGWTEVNTQIKTGPDTHFLLVRAYRAPSRLFENKLTGTVWIADISLISADVDQKEPKP